MTSQGFHDIFITIYHDINLFYAILLAFRLQRRSKKSTNNVFSGYGMCVVYSMKKNKYVAFSTQCPEKSNPLYIVQ